MQAAMGAPPAMHVSTDMFGERQRFDEWRETFALKAVRVDVTVPDRATFRAATRAQPLGQIALVATTTSPVRIVRTRELARDGTDDIPLLICMEGEIDVQARDCMIALKPGAAALVPTSRAGSIGSGGGASTLSITLPRAIVGEMFGGGEIPLRRPVPADNATLRLVRIYARGLMSDPDMLRDGAAAALADRQIRELIAHLFDPTAELARGAPAGGLKAARLRAIITGIEQNLGNPDLSAAWLGAKLGVSDRYVQHLLAEQGASFSEIVRRKRVERARQMLEEPRATPRRIVDVAFALGFGDLSGFNRAFRERFGCTPSDVLHKRTLN